LKGEKSSFWKGGICRLPYPFGFDDVLKAKIRERDGYKCMFCGVPQIECEKLLPIHHIDYDKNNCAIENLITLCIRCHSKTNHYRKKWQSYFESLMKKIYNYTYSSLNKISGKV